MFKRKIIEETEQPDKRSKHDISESDSLSETWRTWKDNLTRLIAYRDAHDGDCNVPQTWKDDPQLGIWVKNQKAQFREYEKDPTKSSRTTSEQISLLKEIGAIKSWLENRRYRRTWEENLTRLIAYRDEHEGNCNVPQSYKDDPQLGIWVITQKKNLRDYKVNPVESRLSADQVAKLQEIGAITSWSSTARRKWKENLMRLIAYRDANEGDCDVPPIWENDQRLANWVKLQKTQFRKYKKDPAKSQLNPKRIYYLEKIGAIKSWFPSKKSEEEEICDKKEEESDDETEEESEEILDDETEDESEEIFEIETEEESDEEASLNKKIVILKNDIKKIQEETKSIPIVTSL